MKLPEAPASSAAWRDPQCKLVWPRTDPKSTCPSMCAGPSAAKVVSVRASALLCLEATVATKLLLLILLLAAASTATASATAPSGLLPGIAPPAPSAATYYCWDRKCQCNLGCFHSCSYNSSCYRSRRLLLLLLPLYDCMQSLPMQIGR